MTDRAQGIWTAARHYRNAQDLLAGPGAVVVEVTAELRRSHGFSPRFLSVSHSTHTNPDGTYWVTYVVLYDHPEAP